MHIYRERIGFTAGHEEQASAPVDSYKLDTGKGYAITIWTYGATLVEVLVPDRQGYISNVVERLPDLDSYENGAADFYVGSTLGRFARCIANGYLRIDGIEYQLDRNAGRHHIHGGSVGFNRFVWDAHAEHRGDELSLHLHLDRPNGDQGYPGAISVETVYQVCGDGRITFDYTATTTASTVVALTNHSFWNLACSDTINAHQLSLNSTRFLRTNDEFIPIASPVNVTGTWLNYSSPRFIHTDPLDHCFVLDDPAWAAELFAPASGRCMRVVTDQPGLAVYSADNFIRSRAGLCLQTGSWPDAPNHEDYPSARLDPGDTYRHHTTHEFTIR